MRLDIADYYGDPDAYTETVQYLKLWPECKHQGMGIGYYSPSQGTGKTFLATFLAKELVKQGESVFYIHFRDIMPLYNLPLELRKPYEERIKDTTFLVMDEVVKTISDSQKEYFGTQLEELVRHRTNYNRVTAITTNLKPKELDKEYPRTFSLLTAKEKHVEVKGNDVRRSKIYDRNKELLVHGERRPLS